MNSLPSYQIEENERFINTILERSSDNKIGVWVFPPFGVYFIIDKKVFPDNLTSYCKLKEIVSEEWMKKNVKYSNPQITN